MTVKLADHCAHPLARGWGVNHPRFPELLCSVCGSWFTDEALSGRNALAKEQP